MKKNVIIILLTVAVSAAEKMNTEQNKPLPRVLLIGDSIRGGYQQGVKKLLAGKAFVVAQQGDLSRKVADNVVAALASRGTAATPDKKAPGTKTPVRVLQDEFLKLKFGMFLHFNLATYKGVQWVSGYHDPSTFNPGVDTIDTDAWADAAVSAGMTYGVLTVKHVSGFCLWDSKYTTYDVIHPDCPYQKDLVAQFIK